MNKPKTWNQLCAIVRNAPYGFVYHTAEQIINEAQEAEDKPFDDGKTMEKAKYLAYSVNEYMITDIFQVGHILVKLVGHEYPNSKSWQEADEDGNIKWHTKKLEGTRGRFFMFRMEHIEPIDVFAIPRDIDLHPIDNYKYCSREEITALAQKHSDIMEKRSEDVTVNFPSGRLAIANYFCEERKNGFDDLPEDIKYKDEFSINTAVGRQNTAQWLADNRGIAYGQFGNTTCSVYKVNNDKLVITACDPYIEDEDDYEIELPKPEGWEYLGDVSLGVWRLELVDYQALTDYGFDLPEYKEKNDHMDFLDTEVNAGEWEMKTYYNQRSDEQIQAEFGYPVWAELNRKV